MMTAKARKDVDLVKDDFPERLREQLGQPLPGRVAQRRFLPELSFGRYYIAPPSDARHAAVVALHYPAADGTWTVPLTLRPTHLKDHAGQVCLPGGSIEPGESIEQAAVRELNEELDISPDEVRIVGRLTPIYLYASGFYVTPIVATSVARPAMTANPDEVAELLEVPVSHLLDEDNYGQHPHDFGDKSRVRVNVGHIQFQSHQIWGATAIMLGELIAVLRQM